MHRRLRANMDNIAAEHTIYNHMTISIAVNNNDIWTLYNPTSVLKQLPVQSLYIYSVPILKQSTQ